jgi:hypothetical protein
MYTHDGWVFRCRECVVVSQSKAERVSHSYSYGFGALTPLCGGPIFLLYL